MDWMVSCHSLISCFHLWQDVAGTFGYSKRIYYFLANCTRLLFLFSITGLLSLEVRFLIDQLKTWPLLLQGSFRREEH